MYSKTEYSPRSSIDTVTGLVYLPSRQSRWREKLWKAAAWAPITISWLLTVVLLFCLLVKDSSCIPRQESESFWKRYEFRQ